jgi:3-oxoacyl-[acyl-carrier-protein] synthase II
MSRVLITGLGVVSPAGSTIESYWAALLAGAVAPSRFPWTDERYVGDPLTYSVAEPKRREVSDAGLAIGRASQFAIRAAEMCLADAAFNAGDAAPIGVSMGTGMGHADLLEDEREGAGAAAPLERFAFEAGSTVAARLHLRGPNLSVSTACSAGAYSVSLAVEAIRAGLADAILAGGCEAFSRVAFGCFRRLGALDPVACRPFDAGRAGTVFGEGAAMLLLESEEHARRRGRTSYYAAVSGAGWSCDAYHPTAPEPGGQQTAAALQRALEDANLRPEDIDCVVPHGTGTELNDVVESSTLAQVFGPHLNRLRIFGLKSVIGHSGGGAGAFSCVTAALMLHYGMVPPTANLVNVDPRCELPLHTGTPVTGDLRRALVNAYAFGGTNISVILEKAHVH